MSPRTGLGAFAALLDQAGVDSELVRTTRDKLPDADHFDGALALGGSPGAYDPRLLDTRRWVRNSVLRGLPFLGVCLGGQLLASAFGGVVGRDARPEVGVHDVFLTDAAKRDQLFAGLTGRLSVFGWHEDSFDLPPNAIPLAGSVACTDQAFRFGAAAYGLQFHPEVRAGDLARWRDVPAYRALLERAGGDWDAVAVELEQATPALDAVSERLLDRWLSLVRGAAALRERPLGVAV
jgi:GMP synthase-like glutamine amidotransferase